MDTSKGNGMRAWEALDQERSFFAEMLHDSVSQSLTALALASRVLCHELDECDPEVRREAAALAAEVEACVAQLHLISRVLAPRDLVAQGLAEALVDFATCLPPRDRARVRLGGGHSPVVLPGEVGVHCFAIGRDLLRTALGRTSGDVEVAAWRDVEGARLRIDARDAGAFPVMYELPAEMRERALEIPARLCLAAGRSRAELLVRDGRSS